MNTIKCGGSPSELIGLPSRELQELSARDALREANSVIVEGTRGSGRTTFSTRIAAAEEESDPRLLQLLGSPELSDVPFAHLAILAAHIPELARYQCNPLESLAGVGARLATHPMRIVIDDADFVDSESAAVLTQLAGAELTQLVVVLDTHGARRPEAFSRFATHARTVVTVLEAISDTDARVFLEAITEKPVNPSAAHTLLAEARGSLTQLEAIGRAALASGRLVTSCGYLVLQPGEADSALGNTAAAHEPLPSDPPAVRAQRALWLAHEGVPVSPELIAEWVGDAGIPADTRLALEAVSIARESYGGDPAGALHRVFEYLGGELWEESGTQGRSELMYVVHLAVMNEGSHELIHESRFQALDWESLNLDHGLYITARACIAIEYGRVAEALELATQALALSQLSDPHRITGFTAAVGAAAAAMMGDCSTAKELLDLFRSGVPYSGSLLRPEAERLSLWAIATVEGADAGLAEYQRLRRQALAAGHRFVVMRLDHEAWRLRLTGSLDDLAESASGVSGQLATALRLLRDPERVEEAANSLHGDGRTLFAAELVAQAARDAREKKKSARAHALLNRATELEELVPEMNTPRLARVRLDPEILSRREIEVCVRAASGHTNAEIAHDLFLSHRTVEGHLQRAYAKLGVSDRRQILPG